MKLSLVLSLASAACLALIFPTKDHTEPKPPSRIYANNTHAPINTDSLKSTGWFSAIEADIKKKSYMIDASSNGKAGSINLAHGLATAYEAGGFSLSSLQNDKSNWNLSLKVKGLYANGMLTYAPGNNMKRQIKKTELNYSSGAMTVQYQNTEAGVRQNFIIEKPEANTNEIRVKLNVSEGWVVRKLNNTEVELAKEQEGNLQTTLRYRDLKVWDSAGTNLPAHMEVQGNEIALVVASKDATYPITIDPVVTADTYLMANGTGYKFGNSVAAAGDINGDNYDDIVVGVPLAPSGGSAYVFYGTVNGISSTPATILGLTGLSPNQTGFAGSVAGGDFNGDGFGDVMTGGRNNACIFYGSANGLSTTPDVTISGYNINQVYPGGDVNGDGYGDMLATGTNHYVFYGSSTGLALTPGTTITGYPITGIASAGDVNGDGYIDLMGGAYLTNNGRGEAYLFLGSAAGLATTAAATLTDPDAINNDEFGYTVAAGGDTNGDGYGDVIVSAHYASLPGDQAGSNKGKTYVYHGNASGLTNAPAVTINDPRNHSGDNFGWSAACAGDVNADGYADILVGELMNNFPSDVGNGYAFLFMGSASGVSSTPDNYYPGLNTGTDYFSRTLAGAGDVNGDGFSDFMIPAYGSYGESGVVHFYLGKGSDGLSTSPNATITGANNGDNFGVSVASAGDVNADGFNDVMVGANFTNSSQGKAYLYLGSAAGLATTAAVTLSDPMAVNNDRFGVCVASAGDLNGDGLSDVVVGAQGVSSNQGAAYVYYGNSTGISSSVSVTLTDPAATATDRFGRFVSGAGDVNGDGYSDLIVGAFGTLSTQGKAYVYYGSSVGISASPSLTLNDPGAASGDNFGWGLATAGDVNADGYADVLIGAYGTLSNQGKAYLYLGSSTGLPATPSVSFSDPAATSADFFGYDLAGAGDLNGDGYGDIIIGSYGANSNAGKAYVYNGSSNGPGSTPSLTISNPSGSITFGRVVSGAGDVNGDGYSDAVIAEGSTGKSFTFHGSPSGLNASPAVSFTNGSSAGFAGDVNGDGYSDVVASKVSGPSAPGSVFLYGGNLGYGKTNNLLRLYETDLVTPLKASNVISPQFGVGLFVRPFQGYTKARLIWETETNGIPFQVNTTLRNYLGSTAGQTAYTVIPPAGIELKALINKVGRSTKLRVRVQYQTVWRPNGQIFGNWIYPQAYLNGTLGAGVLYSPSQALPITLVSFTGVKVDKANRLEWRTGIETAGSVFTVQRSADGVVFTSLGQTVSGKGDNSSYTFNDNDPLVPISYYRLQGKELTGALTYSKIIALRRGVNERMVRVSPVPSMSTVTLTNANPLLNGTQATVWDMQGRIVYRFKLASSYSIDISRWPAGVYNIGLADGSVLKVVRE